jgi:hypothetical protein
MKRKIPIEEFADGLGISPYEGFFDRKQFLRDLCLPTDLEYVTITDTPDGYRIVEANILGGLLLITS